MLKSILWQGLLALSLAVPWLPAAGQTLPTTPAEQDRARFQHLVEPLLRDPRLTTGRLLDAAMPLTDVTCFTGQENLSGAVPITALDSLQQRPGLPPQQPSADAETWRLAYGALLTGAVPAQPYPLTGLPTLNDRLDEEPLDVRDDHLNRYPVVDLLLAYVPYQRLRPDAFTANLLTVTSPDSQLVPVAGAASPFQAAEAFLVAPARLVAHGATVLFHYQPSRYFVNGSGRQFTTLRVDFGDGQGPQTLPPDTYIRIRYTQPGRRVLHFVLTDVAGATLHAYGHLTVTWPDDAVARPTTSTGYDAAPNGNNRAYHFPLNDPFFRYRENFPDPDPTYGPIPRSVTTPFNPVPQQSPTFVPVTVRHGATVTVSYGGNRNIGSQTAIAPLFHKPIIVVEGFDGWKFNGEDNYSFKTFLTEEGRGIERIVFDPAQTPVTFFADHLADNDHDLIFVDFDEGTGDIRRNAMLVANVIEWVKAHYDPAVVPAGQVPDSDHKIVIWGQSMGGLIARFALGYLDRGTAVLAGVQPGTGSSILNLPQPHPGVTAWVKLLVTRDSPHQGAVTTPGAQIGLRRMANVELGRFVVFAPLLLPWATLRLEDMVERVRKYHAMGYEPAALQLMLYQDRYQPNLIVPGTHTKAWEQAGGPLPLPGGQHAGNEFRAFQYRPMITYPTNQPPPYELAALSNGSECGTPQPYAAYSELARFESHFYLNPIVPVTMAAVGGAVSHVPVIGTVAGAALIGIAIATATLSGKDLDTEVIINTLPDPAGGPRRIWHARVKTWIEIIPFLHFWPLKKIRIPIRLFESDADSPPGMPTYDLAPGGYFTNDLGFEVPSWVNTSGFATVFIDNQARFQAQADWNFVPTASAVDYSGPGSTYTYNGQTLPGQDVIMRGFTDDNQPNNQARFANYLTQEPSRSLRQNTRHIQFTTRSARFVYGLMTDNTTLTAASCAATCGVSGISISGPNNVCAGGAVYSCVPAGLNASHVWVAATGLLIVDAAPDNSWIRVVRTGEVNGSGGLQSEAIKITLQVAQDCYAFAPAEKIVSALDQPIPPTDLASTLDRRVPCHYDRLNVSTPEALGTETYDWTRSISTYTALGNLVSTRNFPPVVGSPTPPDMVTLMPSQNGYHAIYTLNLTMRSNCGTPAVIRTYLERMDATKYDPDGTCHGRKPGDDGTDPIDVYPNAADEKFLVQLIDDSVEIWPDDPALLSEFKLYDMYGVEQVAKTEPTKETEIWTHSLPNGPYILRVRRGDRFEMRRISIEH